MSTIAHYLQILSQFDYVIVQVSGSVKAVQQATGKPCVFLPSGADALLFCPYPDAPERVIDVYSIGRRAESTHRALKRMAAQRGMFYVYDTADAAAVIDGGDHRALFASMAKRSRYFIVNPAKVDATAETGGQSEFGSRFFEGAAAGTIMLGEAPKTVQFADVFNWPDAVVDVPFGSDKIATVVKDLDAEPDTQRRIRATNVVQSLLRHDWTYRWEAILNLVGLETSGHCCRG
jgi:hypothetical protein